MIIKSEKAVFFLISFFVFLSFFQGVNTSESAAMIRGIRVALIIFSLIIFAVILYARPKILQLQISGYIVLIYLIYCMLTLIQHPEALFGAWKLTELLYYVITVLICLNFSTKLPKHIFTIQKYCFDILLINLVISTVMFPDLAFNEINGAISYQLRGGIIPLNANELAAIAFMQACFFRKQKNWRQYVAIIIILMTQNRTSLPFIFLLFLSDKKWYPLIFMIAISAIIAGAEQIIALVFRDWGNFLTFNGRVILWTGVLNSMEHPQIFGDGFYVAHRFDSFDISFFQLENPNTFDNTFLDIYYDTGIVGLILFLALYFVFVAKLLRYNSECKFARYINGVFALFVLADAFMGPGYQTFGTTLTHFVLYLLAVENKKKSPSYSQMLRN